MLVRESPKKQHHSFCYEAGKLGYNSWIKANQERERMMREELVDEGYHLNIYRCDRCGLYHIGSVVNGSKRRSIKKKIKAKKKVLV